MKDITEYWQKMTDIFIEMIRYDTYDMIRKNMIPIFIENNASGDEVIHIHTINQEERTH